MKLAEKVLIILVTIGFINFFVLFGPIAVLLGFRIDDAIKEKQVLPIVQKFNRVVENWKTQRLNFATKNFTVTLNGKTVVNCTSHTVDYWLPRYTNKLDTYTPYYFKPDSVIDFLNITGTINNTITIHVKSNDVGHLGHTFTLPLKKEVLAVDGYSSVTGKKDVRPSSGTYVLTNVCLRYDSVKKEILTECLTKGVDWGHLPYHYVPWDIKKSEGVIIIRDTQDPYIFYMNNNLRQYYDKYWFSVREFMILLGAYVLLFIPSFLLEIYVLCGIIYSIVDICKYNGQTFEQLGNVQEGEGGEKISNTSGVTASIVLFVVGIISFPVLCFNIRHLKSKNRNLRFIAGLSLFGFVFHFCYVLYCGMLTGIFISTFTINN